MLLQLPSSSRVPALMPTTPAAASAGAELVTTPPRTAVTARITIDQRLIWLPEGEWELRFPTVIGPRYIGSADTPEDVRATHIKVGQLGARIHVSLAIKDAITARPSSPSH